MTSFSADRRETTKSNAFQLRTGNPLFNFPHYAGTRDYFIKKNQVSCMMPLLSVTGVWLIIELGIM